MNVIYICWLLLATAGLNWLIFSFNLKLWKLKNHSDFKFQGATPGTSAYAEYSPSNNDSETQDFKMFLITCLILVSLYWLLTLLLSLLSSSPPASSSSLDLLPIRTPRARGRPDPCRILKIQTSCFLVYKKITTKSPLS